MSGNVKTKKTNNTKYKKKKKRFRIFKTLLLIFFCVFFLCSVAAAGFIFATVKNAPELDVNGTILNLAQASQLYDDSGNPMDTVITNQKRVVVSLKDVPANLSHAFVSIEDERFYKHNGIDLKRIAGALYGDIKSKIHRQNNIQGASTITQQLIKTRLFLNDSLQNRLSLRRKIQEAYLSIQLEKHLSKDQILEAYMNTIYLGGQANGVETAAEQYFGTDVKNLNLIQCAFIAGLAQSPSAYYPFSPNAQKNHNIYLNRTKTVLFKMKDNGYINNLEYQNALNDLNNNKLTFPSSKLSNKYAYEWFSIPVVEQVKKDLKTQYQYTDEEIDNLLRDGNLKIYTTMNTNLQNKAQEIINTTKYLQDVTHTDKHGIIQPEASAAIFDYHTGEVKALIGGRGTQPPTSYNRAASNSYLRPTGSSIKPLTVYSPSIDTKLITSETTINDSELSPELQSKYGSNGDPYNPKNDDGVFANTPLSVRTAIAESKNVIAVKVEDKLGLTTGVSYADKFGLKFNNTDKSSIAAVALGEFSGSNTLTMSAAYGVFGNQGLYSTPRLYTKVVDKKGNVLLQSSYATKKVISPQAAYIMYDLLKGPMDYNDGTGTHARDELGEMPAGGKTGSSTGFRDLWFCGLTPYYSAAVWVGNDDHSIPGIYSNGAAGIWGQIMHAASQNEPIKNMQMPDGIVQIGNDIFIDGTAPTSLDPNDDTQNSTNEQNTQTQPQTNTLQNQNQNQNQHAQVPSNNQTNTNTNNVPQNNVPSNNNSQNNNNNNNNNNNSGSNSENKH